jgi:hypothetical protein
MKTDYSTGKIYKLVSTMTDKVYIGSTKLPLNERLNIHLNHYKSFLNKKYHYVSSFLILENDDYEIILIEDYPCETKEQLKDREQFYILSNECVNKNIPNRTKKQYYLDNKERIKNYYQINKERFKNYYQNNKERFKNYYQNNKEILLENQKNYYSANKEVIYKKKKDYYIKNRDRIKEQSKQYYLQHKNKK